VHNNAVIIEKSLIIKQNRDKLIPIIECILLCGYQEIILRSSMKGVWTLPIENS